MTLDSNAFDSNNENIQARKHWMSVLARAEASQLEQALSELEAAPKYMHLRPPEIGMAMVRGRADAKGDRFNLGEMTISRCSIRLEDGLVGHGYVTGRNKRHAELAALFDAMLQAPGNGPVLTESVIEPLHAIQVEKRQTDSAKTAATKVNFFTMVRGED
ncbi:phosphonate C-P lyase system protein PhnG [Pseudodesulfovibrio profundus]|uniref:phosphonate C-P lyase system protein PhnG n=1 Tax=Pseudodesulfovibrio profundus TaxID=57320 RepID=UPI000BE48682|nr:phosphonate C-P lyase system protein PhnG [Pseudodesulfovibrio profundus]